LKIKRKLEVIFTKNFFLKNVKVTEEDDEEINWKTSHNLNSKSINKNAVRSNSAFISKVKKKKECNNLKIIL